jgi:hypothetical protein
MKNENIILKNENIPVAVLQIGENALNPNNKSNIKYNYIQTLKNIRDYCNQVISVYEKSDDRLFRKTKVK